MEDLLDATPREILRRFMEDQKRDFLEQIRKEPIESFFPSGLIPGGELLPYLEKNRLEELFIELHDHVMNHPVWLHPFFVRIFEGRFHQQQAERFALQYFNQIKNTRQCVALSLGRFYSGLEKSHGNYSERISEITQIVLSQLIADEYGVKTEEIENYPGLKSIFQSTTHIVLYRQFLEGLNIPFEHQDLPMIPEVADNVLVQRILAGNDAFTPLESLSSVGLGMEWGVPEFFSLILAGLIRFAYKESFPFTQRHLYVFIAHVKYDVMHAISVMFATVLYIRSQQDVESIKGAVNTLMAARYDMMSGLYRDVFQEQINFLKEVPQLDKRYFLTDHRMVQELQKARARVAEDSVIQSNQYKNKKDHPFPIL